MSSRPVPLARTLLPLLLLGLVPACRRSQAAPGGEADAAQQAPGVAATPGATGANGATEAPGAAGAAETVEAASAGAAEAARAAGFPPPAGWVAVTPASAMRVAQFRLPGDGGKDAEVVVYHFGGGGGSVEANLERWRGQFADSDGGTTEKHERDGLAFTTLDVTGRYVAETAPGSGEHVDEEDMRMLATVIEGEGGPWYVKCVGPADVLARWQESYGAFLAGVAP